MASMVERPSGFTLGSKGRMLRIERNAIEFEQPGISPPHGLCLFPRTVDDRQSFQGRRRGQKTFFRIVDLHEAAARPGAAL